MTLCVLPRTTHSVCPFHESLIFWTLPFETGIRICIGEDELAAVENMSLLVASLVCVEQL